MDTAYTVSEQNKSTITADIIHGEISADDIEIADTFSEPYFYQNKPEMLKMATASSTIHTAYLNGIDDNITVTFKDVISFTKNLSIIDFFISKINHKLNFPTYWIQEGFNKPNIIAKENAIFVCSELFTKYDLIPDKILASKEEGIYITYDLININDNISLVIETYNDNEIAVVVKDNRNKKILYSEDIKNLNFENAIRILKKENF